MYYLIYFHFVVILIRISEYIMLCFCITNGPVANLLRSQSTETGAPSAPKSSWQRRTAVKSRQRNPCSNSICLQSARLSECDLLPRQKTAHCDGYQAGSKHGHRPAGRQSERRGRESKVARQASGGEFYNRSRHNGPDVFDQSSH